jgi:tetratricopeptide (TPR) repeat protein
MTEEIQVMGKLIRLALSAALVSTAGAALKAQDDATDKLYGAGVHAYFAGNFEAALEQLDAAVAAGSRDPRCYFYRGLTSWKLGNAAAAKTNFSEGARLEAANPELSRMISRSMQRVQGSTRLTIERFRADAQVAALAARKARDATRYGATRASAIEELRRQAEAQKSDATLLPDAAATPDTGAAEKNPFADEQPADAATEPPEEMPADDATTPDAGATDPDAPIAPPDESTPADDTTPADEGDVPEVTAPDEAPPPDEKEDDLFGEPPAP